MRTALVVLAIILATGTLALTLRLVPGRYQLVVTASGSIVHRLDTATGEMTAFVLAGTPPSARVTERTAYWPVAQWRGDR